MRNYLSLIVVSAVMASCASPVHLSKDPDRKVAAEAKSCADLGQRQAQNGYKNSDQDIVKSLRNYFAFRSTCHDEAGNKLKGPQYPAKISKSNYLTSFYCDYQYAPAIAANVAFKKEFGSSYAEVVRKIELKHNPKANITATTEQRAQISAETEPYRVRYQALINNDEKKANAVIDGYAEEICFHETEKELLSKAALKECSLPDLSEPEYVPVAIGPTQPPARTSKGLGMLLKLDTILKSNKDCDLKSQDIQNLFQNGTVTNLDDLVLITYVSRNIEYVLENPALLGVFASAMKGDLIFEPFCRNTDKNCDGIHSSMHVVRNSLIKAELEALSDAGAPGLDFFDNLSSEAKAKVVTSTVDTLEKILKNPTEANAYSETFRDECDGILSDLFGDEGSVLTGSGYALSRDAIYEKNGKVCGNENIQGCTRKILQTGSYNTSVGHSFLQTHIYVDKNLSEELGKPTYAPSNWTSAGKGGGWASKGSFLLHYKRFGRYRNVIYNPNHLANYEMLGNKSNQRNKMNWVQIGNIGGKGGGGVADRAAGMVQSDSPYVHSHLQIFQAANGKVMLNFQDAFCRGKPAP